MTAARASDATREVWRPILGWESLYEVSDFGRVRSLARTAERVSRWGTPATYRVRARMRALIPDEFGYLGVSLYQDKRVWTVRVHTLVLSAFVGPCPEGMECRHLDGNPSNNRLENLAWGTRLENAGDRHRHGTTLAGEKNHASKASDAEVAEIRALLAAGKTGRSVADQFGLSESCISKIRTGKARGIR